MTVTHILLEGVKKSYSDTPVLKGINLRIQKGEFVAIVGQSGCGKSTLLRLLAGLESQDKGFIQMDDEPLTALNKKARIMFQDGRLLPWKRVIDNICIGLTKEKRPKAVEALANVGLTDKMYEWPRQLSGGQKQRVDLVRALVHDPDLLLLDEPLGALDALTRIEMQALVESLWRNNHLTPIIMTHDVEEAVAISDRVVLIENGVISWNQPIHLPRPRRRTDPTFSTYVKDILDQIMGRTTPSTYGLNHAKTVDKTS